MPRLGGPSSPLDFGLPLVFVDRFSANCPSIFLPLLCRVFPHYPSFPIASISFLALTLFAHFSPNRFFAPLFSCAMLPPPAPRSAHWCLLCFLSFCFYILDYTLNVSLATLLIWLSFLNRSVLFFPPPLSLLFSLKCLPLPASSTGPPFRAFLFPLGPGRLARGQGV